MAKNKELEVLRSTTWSKELEPKQGRKARIVLVKSKTDNGLGGKINKYVTYVEFCPINQNCSDIPDEKRTFADGRYYYEDERDKAEKDFVERASPSHYGVEFHSMRIKK